MVDEAIGKTFAGHYRILKVLGSGGLAIVYNALDTRHQRVVALKVLQADLAKDPEIKARLTREFEVLRHLSHPNILQIYEYGEADGVVFLALEFVDGGSLARFLMEGKPLAPDYAIEITRRVGAALAYAHQRGLVHRDVKPSNILISTDGRVLLSDFELAALAGAVSLTRFGMVLGSVAYMSPEQAIGQRIDGRSDVFALGVTLYEMLTAHRPFAGESHVDTLRNVVERSPTPPREFNPGLPPAVEQVVLKSLAKDPQHRYQSADDFVNDLAAAGIGSVASSPDVALGPMLLQPAAACDVAPGAVPGLDTARTRLAPTSVPALARSARVRFPLWVMILAGMGLLALVTLAGVGGGLARPSLGLLAVLFAVACVFAVLRFARLVAGSTGLTTLRIGTLSQPTDAPAVKSEARTGTSLPYTPPLILDVLRSEGRVSGSTGVGQWEELTAATFPYKQAPLAATQILRVEQSAYAWLLVLNGPLRGRQFRLNDTIAIGRSAGCDVRLEDISVSRQHASVYLRNNRFWVMDLGSRSPTHVNGTPVLGPTELRDRDEIYVGNTIMLFIQAVTPEDLTAEAKNRLREFDSVWDQLMDSIRHD